STRDWSSDVCSSDLRTVPRGSETPHNKLERHESTRNATAPVATATPKACARTEASPPSTALYNGLLPNPALYRTVEPRLHGAGYSADRFIRAGTVLVAFRYLWLRRHIHRRCAAPRQPQTHRGRSWTIRELLFQSCSTPWPAGTSSSAARGVEAWGSYTSRVSGAPPARPPARST